MLVGTDDHRSTHWFRYPPILELPTNIHQDGIFMDQIISRHTLGKGKAIQIQSLTIQVSDIN